MFMVGDDEIPINNGAVLSILQVIKSVMSSATEAELATLFINSKTAISMCTMLKKLGHQQMQTPMQTNNSTAHALLTNKILPKVLKAMDMRFHWHSGAVKPKDNIGITGDQAHKTLLIT
jgi:hypothetical protein